jgi:hypothetical protein
MAYQSGAWQIGVALGCRTSGIFCEYDFYKSLAENLDKGTNSCRRVVQLQLFFLPQDSGEPKR